MKNAVGSGSKWLYLWLFVIAAGSWVCAWLLPISVVMKELASVPGAFALIGAVFQLLRDQATHERQLLRDEAAHDRQVLRDDAAHDRQLLREEITHQHQCEIQRTQESFSLGATSHMANVAFDKHVAFCEEYLEEMHKIVITLFREGPDEAALDHCKKLYEIRRKYATWITRDLVAALTPYETALRTIGAAAHFVETTRLTGNERRNEKIDEMHRLFEAVLGEAVGNGEPDPERDTDQVMGKLREILGIEELTLMRVRLVKRALKASE